MVIGIGVGVYADVACSQNLTGISWGKVAPGESVNRKVYVKNTGQSTDHFEHGSVWLEPACNKRPDYYVQNRNSHCFSELQLLNVVTPTLKIPIAQTIPDETRTACNTRQAFDIDSQLQPAAPNIAAT